MTEDNVTMTQGEGVPVAEDALKTYGAQVKLRDEIAQSFYNQAAVYEAKKKDLSVGSFQWELYDIRQADFLLAAKHVEHWPIEHPLGLT